MNPEWKALADAQEGMLARRQLGALGISSDRVRNQITSGRWKGRSNTVISTFTGALTRIQRCWLGLLHAGGPALVGGLTACEWFGLRRWERPDVTVLVRHPGLLEPVPGIRFVRTRRPLSRLALPGSGFPVCQLEPAVLLVAAYSLSNRASQGLLAATVQQKLSTPARLGDWLRVLTPLHRAPLFREVLVGIAGGAESVGELDIDRICREFDLPRPTRQTKRRDAAGRWRYTDCEWQLSGGHVIVLEVDGGFHMLVEHWEDDMVRERGLVDPKRHVLRCTTRELRDDPGRVVADLRRLGVGRPVVAR